MNIAGPIIFVIGTGVIIAAMAHIFYNEIWCKLPRSCKNTAFHEYKAKTYQRILDEEQEFIKYLDAEHAAQEKATFERFMESRK